MKGVNMLNVGEIDGGLLPHHVASIGYFTEESRNQDKYRQVEGLEKALLLVTCYIPKISVAINSTT